MRRALWLLGAPTPRTEQRQAAGPVPPAGRPHSIRFFQVLLPLPASHTSNHHGAAHTLRLAYSRARRRVEPISGILTQADAIQTRAAECLSAVPTFGPFGVKRTCRPRRLCECEDCRYLSVSVLLVDGFRVPHGHSGA